MCSGDVVVTWAIPIETHLLGARLEAFAEEKVPISTLRLCAPKGNPSEAPVARLPFELVEEIVRHIANQSFEKHLQEWAGISDCMTNCCHEKEHREVYHEIHDGHYERVEPHRGKLGLQSEPSKEKKRFRKCRKV